MRGPQAWVVAVLGALALPFPGAHVDRYVALGWVLARAEGGAAAGFWGVAAALLAAYTLATRAALAAISAWRARRVRAVRLGRP